MRRGSSAIIVPAGGAALLAALVVIASAHAKTIVGTPGADVLRGTKAGDAIYGRGGNDRLFGLGGNDRLYGGAGADRIFCGAGVDRVFADRRDTVASDCERVSGAQPRPPHHPPPPPAPPAPPPPPAAPSWVLPGHYVALTEQARYVHLEVYPDGRALRNLRVEFDAECSPPRSLRGPFADVSGDVAVDSDGRFSVAASQDGGRLRLSIEATFDREGNLRGAFRIRTTLDESGTRYECDSATVPFTGKRV